LKPRRKEARKDLKDKIYFFILNAEANRTLDGVQEAISSIIEFTFVQDCILPLMDYISNQGTDKFFVSGEFEFSCSSITTSS